MAPEGRSNNTAPEKRISTFRQVHVVEPVALLDCLSAGRARPYRFHSSLAVPQLHCGERFSCAPCVWV